MQSLVPKTNALSRLLAETRIKPGTFRSSGLLTDLDWLVALKIRSCERFKLDFAARRRNFKLVARCFVAVSCAVAIDAKSTKRSRADLSRDRWTQSPEF